MTTFQIFAFAFPFVAVIAVGAVMAIASRLDREAMAGGSPMIGRHKNQHPAE